MFKQLKKTIAETLILQTIPRSSVTPSLKAMIYSPSMADGESAARSGAATEAWYMD